ncbi:MAG: serine hydroxymethyltransferase [Thermoplasmata archaeon]|nr:MAG: serine hydroxymethyltransferase [Thermoplasmata archaeon]
MISTLVKKHEEYRFSGLNLIASENRICGEALNTLASDLAGRYGDEWYGGSLYAHEIFLEVEKLAKKVFHARYAFITPISGNICNLAVLFSFTKCGDKVAGVPKEKGGYPFGYEKFERKFIPLPTKDYEIDSRKALDVIEKEKPPLTLLGASVFPFPHPVKELEEAKEYGTLAYDASHVLGLIAGGEFQQPLQEGADVMIGSTHKSFPGPQGGIAVTNSREKAESMEKMLCFNFEEGIGLVDNPHPNRIAALGIVLEEILSHGKEYARQIVKNAKSLASCLHENGIPIKFAQKGFTESHQILLDFGDAQSFCKMLEKQSIFIDISGRIGVAEVTHIGMKEGEMQEIANLITEAYKGKDVKERVKRLVKEFYY